MVLYSSLFCPITCLITLRQRGAQAGIFEDGLARSEIVVKVVKEVELIVAILCNMIAQSESSSAPAARSFICLQSSLVKHSKFEVVYI